MATLVKIIQDYVLTCRARAGSRDDDYDQGYSDAYEEVASYLEGVLQRRSD